MHKLEALRILEAKLKSVEEERQAELADKENLQDPIDAKAEARALSAVFEYLKSCKIAPSDSLLRIFKRYLRLPRGQDPIASEQQHSLRGRAKRLDSKRTSRRARASHSS